MASTYHFSGGSNKHTGNKDAVSSPISPFKEWRSNLPQEFNHNAHKEKMNNHKRPSSSSPKKKKVFSPVLGPSLRHTITNPDTLTSVKNSDFARCTIGDHELKLLRELEGLDEADCETTYIEYKRNLIAKNNPHSSPTTLRSRKRVQAEVKAKAKVAKGKELSILSKAQLAYSPLNPDNNNKDTTSLMKKVRQMQLEAGLLEGTRGERKEGKKKMAAREQQPQQDHWGGNASDNDDGDIDESVTASEEMPSPIPYDDSMDPAKEREVEKQFKYVVGVHASSPFTCDLPPPSSTPSGDRGERTSHKPGGEIYKSNNMQENSSSSMLQLRDKGIAKNAQALRKKKEKAEQRSIAAQEKAKRPESKSNKTLKTKVKRTHPYLAHNYSEHLRESASKQKIASHDDKGHTNRHAKLPDKLRKACERKYTNLMKSHQRSSERTWGKLKAKENLQKEKEAITIMGRWSQQPFSLSQSQQSLRQVSGGEEEEEEFCRSYYDDNARVMDEGNGGLFSGDALLFAMEREGLFTVDDFDDLSLASSDKSQELVEDGSEAGLFNTFDLLRLDIDENDPALALLEQAGTEGEGMTPDRVLASSMGSLLFSQNSKAQHLQARPVSAGIGGVSVAPPLSRRAVVKSDHQQDHYSYHHKYSPGIDIESKYKPRPRSASGAGAIPNYVQKKRQVFNRHSTPDAWMAET